MPTKTFRLTEVINDALNDKRSPADPHEIAATLAEEIPSRHLRSVVREILADAVREQIRRQRQAEPPEPDPAPPTRKGTRSNGKRKAGSMSRDPWTMRISVPKMSGKWEWKFLGDLSAEDCDMLADHHETEASKLIHQAERYRRYAKLMRELEATKLREIGPDNL